MKLSNRRKGMDASGMKGFSLMELMVAIVIIAIMAGIAMASYESSVLKSKRKAALSTLMTLASEQEEYFINNKSYATTLTNLGYTNTGATADPLYIDDNGNTSNSTNGSYKITFTAATANAFTLAAAPINQQTHDTQCGTISLMSSGAKSVTGSLDASSCFR